MPIEVVIPNLGITVENGIIIEWTKNEGDAVEKGETLFVVEADKVTTEVESPASGVLAYPRKNLFRLQTWLFPGFLPMPI